VRTDDVSSRILITLRDYAAMKLGPAVAYPAFETAVRDADCTVARATDPRAWVALDVLESVARAFHDTIGPTFVVDATTWVVPLRRELSAMSLSALITPDAFYARIDRGRRFYARHIRFVMKRKAAGRFDVVLRYRDDVPRNAAASCQVARGVLHAAPLLFDLPPAEVKEQSCRSRGADACTYEVRFRSQAPLALAAATGGALLAAAGALAFPTLGWLALPVAAWAVGRELQLARGRRYLRSVTEEHRRALAEHAEFQRRFDEIKALNAALERKLDEHGIDREPK
jgi:hypothetical protein